MLIKMFIQSHFLALILLFSWNSVTDATVRARPTKQFNGVHVPYYSIGAIVDCVSRIGKEEKIAMEMALEDFFKSTNHRANLIVRSSSGEPLQATFHAMELINHQKVQAIVGLRNWEEAQVVAELSNKAQVPILSFAEEAPSWAIEKWPFLVQATHNQRAQMKAAAAIVGSWAWRKVVVLHEETGFGTSDMIPVLSDSLRQVGSEIDHLVALPSFASPTITQELKKLKSGQCRVFLVHLSFQQAASLFVEAEKLGMMEKDYVWIATSGSMNLLHSVNNSIISSMQGVVGIKSYFPKTGQRFMDFSFKFCSRFRSQYPEEEEHNSDPGIFALQAYDAIWAVANSMEGASNTKTVKNPRDLRGRYLLEKILVSNFEGLSGKIHFIKGKLVPASVFQVVNVIGKSYRKVGYWVERTGFVDNIDKFKIRNSSMRDLGQVIWPGAPWLVPRGWALPTAEKPLRIGVPANATFPEFVTVKHDSTHDPSVTGFSIDVFKATLYSLPYYLEHKFIPYEGNYNSLVQQVHLKNFDAVVGDVTILADRFQHVEFSQPYLQSGIIMVVPAKSKGSAGPWLFLKPFTAAMWGLVGAINMYNGAVVWLIERKNNLQLNGSVKNQIGALIWLTFSTLFSWHGEGMKSNLSRFVMLVWLLLALIITSSYTANLSSILTLQKFEPRIANVEELRKSNAIVGCSKNSFIANYLEGIQNFSPTNIKNIISEEDYYQSLKSGAISAAFLEEPYAKVFLAKHCKEFTSIKPLYKVGGFGFVFPKGSPMVFDISIAIQKISENGKLLELENSLIASCKCTKEGSDDGQPLNIDSFWGIFVISGGISTVALVIFLFRQFYKTLIEKGLKWTRLAFKCMREVNLAVMKYRNVKNRRISSIDVERQEHVPKIEGLQNCVT